MTLVQALTLIGIFFSALVSILGILKAVRAVGASEQRLTDKIEQLETDRREDRKRINDILNELALHLKERGIHINPEIEKRVYDETRDWRRSMESKLDLLLREKI